MILLSNNMLAVYRLSIVLVLLQSLSACSTSIPPATVPLSTIASSEERRADTLFVLLPGIGDKPSKFVQHQFFTAAQQLEIKADFIAVDSHFGYFKERSIARRLHEDVVLPARQRGYEAVYLVGVSLGGLGISSYAMQYPDQVDGLVMIAPYLFERSLAMHIAASGGLQVWSASATENAEFDPDAVAVWEFLQRRSRQLVFEDEGSASAPMYLLYGERDKFSLQLNVLAEAMPESHVIVRPGAHRWTVWRKLWRDLMSDTNFEASVNR